MRKLLFLLPMLLGSFQIAHAQSNAKLEAENASYVNCTLIQDSKYSGGRLSRSPRMMPVSPLNIIIR